MILPYKLGSVRDGCQLQCAGLDVGNIEAVPTISRAVFSEVKTRSLHLVDLASPKVPALLSAAVNVTPSAFTVDSKTG